jgi:hypothetical protein
MLISVADDLHDIKKRLELFGYEIHNFSERLPSDIYIYSEKSIGFANMYNEAVPKDNGSFLINADGKGINDILYSIKHRTYSPLF